jgi:hypothetical protein
MKTDSRTLDARAFGFSAGTIAAALTTLCAFGIAVAPQFTTAVASALIHLDLSEMQRTLTWSGYLTGLIGWTVGAGFIFWAAAALYNRFVRQTSAVAEPAANFARATVYRGERLTF